MNGEPAHIKLYNLPQKVEGGIKIYGFKDAAGKDFTLRFHHMDGMYSYCTVDGDDPNGKNKRVVHLSASTPLVELGNDEYRIEEEAESASDKTY